MSKTATRKGVVAGQASTSQDQKPAATPTDWEAIERKYRAGALSVREIAKEHGVSHTAIQKKAKAQGWQRDLTDKVQKAVATKLVASTVASGNASEKAATERQIVEEAANTVVEVVKLHRRDVRKGRDLCALLMDQIEHVATNREVFEEAIVEDTADADDPRAKPDQRAFARATRKAMLAAVSLPGHAAVVRDLSNALHKLVALERQAFNVLDGAGEPDKPKEQEVQEFTDAALAAFDARLAQVLGDAQA